MRRGRVADRQLGGLQRHHYHLLDAVAEVLPGDEGEHCCHEQHLGHVDQLLLGKQVGKALERVEPVELWGNGLETENPAASGDGAGHRGEADQQREKQAGADTRQHHLLHADEHELSALDRFSVETQLSPQRKLQVIDQGACQHYHGNGTHTQDGQVRKVARTCSLAVIARFLQLAAGGW